MIMNKFPNKLPTRIKQYAPRLIISLCIRINKDIRQVLLVECSLVPGNSQDGCVVSQ